MNQKIDSIIDFLWRLKNKRLFKKTYHSFGEALDNCKSHLGFEQDDLVRIIVKKTGAIQKKLFVEKDDTFSHHTITTLLCSVAFRDGALNVLDFGGGSGLHFYYFKSVFGDSIKVKWCVVETPMMCKYVTEMQSDELMFFDNIADASAAMDSVDLVFSSGALQCVSNPVESITELMALGAQYMILSRLNLIADHDTVITIQRSLLSENGQGKLPEGFTERWVEYPNTILNEDIFLETIAPQYAIRMKYPDHTGVYKVNTYQVKGYSALLKKITEKD